MNTYMYVQTTEYSLLIVLVFRLRLRLRLRIIYSDHLQ